MDHISDDELQAIYADGNTTNHLTALRLVFAAGLAAGAAPDTTTAEEAATAPAPKSDAPAAETPVFDLYAEPTAVPAADIPVLTTPVPPAVL